MNRRPAVLLIKDKASVTRGLEAWLMKNRREQRTASTVAEASQILKCRTYDVVLSE